MRVAIVADTHGVLDERIAAWISGCDLAVHGGDIGSASVLDALERRVARVIAVLGNNDVPAKWLPAETNVLTRIPTQAELELPGGCLAVIHGHRFGGTRERHERLRMRFPHARAVAYGHSHQLVCDQEAIPWVLNPGAAGRSRTFGGPSCILLTATHSEWRVEIQRFSNSRSDGASAGNAGSKGGLSFC